MPFLKKNAHAILFEIMETLIERGLTIKALETSLEEKGRIERKDAMEKAYLENALVEEQETRVDLEEKLENIEESHEAIITKLIKERDHAIVKYKVLKKEKVEFGVGNARLIEDIERRDKAHKALECEHSLLILSHDQLQTQLSKNDEFVMSSSIPNVNDACATNSTSCEASILKQNVDKTAIRSRSY